MLDIENIINRKEQKNKFLVDFFKDKKFAISPIDGDAGMRDYYRIASNGQNFILMDCPPAYADIRPFIEIANYLNSTGLVAPNIYCSDQTNGFILLQDFGNHSARDFVNNTQSTAQKLDFYKLSIDILCQLQKNTPLANLPKYTDELLLSELDLFLEWYVPYINGSQLNHSSAQEFRDIWASILKQRSVFDNTTVLRDYHVQNMMILDQSIPSIKSIGLLDFQDALLGSPIYDLVSILEDARIMVDRDLAIQVLKHYSAKTGFDYNDIMLEYSIVGAQRNMRILGVFARKAVRDQASNYLSFIPTVLEYIKYDMSCPALEKLSIWFEENIRAFVQNNETVNLGEYV